MKNTEKVLVQVRIPQSANDELTELRNLTGLTITDIFKYSIAIFKWTVMNQNDGFDIYAIPQEGNEAEAKKIKLLLPI